MGRAAPHKRGWSRLANATNEIVRLSALRPRLVGFLGDERDHKDTTRAQTAPRERGGCTDESVRGGRGERRRAGLRKTKTRVRVTPPLTAAEIAKALGTSCNAVIGRSRRLRGIVYQSDIDSWTRANARRSAEAHKRAEIRGELQSKVIAEMVKSLSSGVPKERAMEKAFKAGAYWWQIGEHFGMSQQTAYETVKRAKKKRARK